MKKTVLRAAALLLLLCVGFAALFSCGPMETPDPDGENPEEIDYAAEVKLDMSADTLKQEVTVYNYVDGDTTHFTVPKTIEPSGVLKARYLAINTPESTGIIEEWGHAASVFTRGKLESADSIFVESDNGEWNHDSNGRMLVWVWYRPSGASEYRNLNIEILQNGLAIASNSANNRYGSVAMAAIAQAKALKYHIYSGAKDPDFYYGPAKLVTLKAVRTAPDRYVGKDVVFDAVIVRESSNTLYVEEYDEEDGIYYGITVYYGYNADPTLLSMFRLGNRIQFIGNVQYYEAGGTYQVAGLKYNARKPDESCALLSQGNEIEYVETDPQTFAAGKKTVTVMEQDEDGEAIEVAREFDYAALAMSTTVCMSDLAVQSIYTTANGGSSDGAMTLTCEAQDGTRITVRTVVLTDEAGALVTASAFEGKTLSVRGLVDYFSGEYQIKVFSYKDIVIQD